jgi:T5SS/PEP-CTERM-associated repeat protein
VNVTGPDAIFLSTARDITVGSQGTGTLTVTDGGLVQSFASIIIGDNLTRLSAALGFRLPGGQQPG